MVSTSSFLRTFTFCCQIYLSEFWESQIWGQKSLGTFELLFKLKYNSKAEFSSFSRSYQLWKMQYTQVKINGKKRLLLDFPKKLIFHHHKKHITRMYMFTNVESNYIFCTTEPKRMQAYLTFFAIPLEIIFTSSIW